MTGYTPEEHYADPDLGMKIVHPEDRELLSELLAGEGEELRSPVSLRWVRKDGEVIWTEQKNVPIYDDLGRWVAIEGIARDITARKRAERALDRYNQRLAALHNTDRAILELRPLAELAQVAAQRLLELVECDRTSLAMIGAKGQVATVVAATERSGSTGKDLGAEIPLGELEDFLEALQSGEVVYFADLLDAPESVAFWRQLRDQGFQALAVAPLIYRGELLGGLNLLSRTTDAFSAEDLEIAREVADSLAIAAQNARLLSAVQERSEQVRALARRMQELEEAERKYIAHELHDRVGQDVTALSINLKVIENLLPEAVPARVRERLEESLTLIEQTASHVRYIMDDLRPAVLDDYGLPAALRWQGERFGDRTGIRVAVEAPEEGLPVNPEVEWTLFRIVSEALNNVAKHAGAEQVNIKLELAEALVQLSVEDDGIGLEASARAQEGQAGGLGIEMMRERAAALGGSITMESGRGRGTTLRVHVPR
jgi:PAS domain S-box-containing protein